MGKEKKLFVLQNLHYLFYAFSILGAVGHSWIPFLRDRTDGFWLVMGPFFVAALLQLRQERENGTGRKRKNLLWRSIFVGVLAVIISCVIIIIRVLT